MERLIQCPNLSYLHILIVVMFVCRISATITLKFFHQGSKCTVLYWKSIKHFINCGCGDLIVPYRQTKGQTDYNILTMFQPELKWLRHILYKRGIIHWIPAGQNPLISERRKNAAKCFFVIKLYYITIAMFTCRQDELTEKTEDLGVSYNTIYWETIPHWFSPF